MKKKKKNTKNAKKSRSEKAVDEGVVLPLRISLTLTSILHFLSSENGGF